MEHRGSIEGAKGERREQRGAKSSVEGAAGEEPILAPCTSAIILIKSLWQHSRIAICKRPCHFVPEVCELI